MQPTITTAEELLYQTALLAGLGPCARSVAAEQMALLNTPAGDIRTCIDGGSRLMFALLAPAPRSLRVLTRSTATAAGVIPWRRTHYLPDGGVERWYSETYNGEPPAAWTHARDAAEHAGDLPTLRQIHASLGPHSRLYTVSWSLAEQKPRAWVGWQLDRTCPVNEALAALGYGSTWPAAAAWWAELLGFAPHPRRGPWSINLALGEGPRLRLGSTNWARCAETGEKRRRLGALIERQEDDRRFAEALYQLIEAASPPGRPRAVGRAVELELLDGQVGLAEFYLCLS